jgi:predicted  nucleic acid-binding Zn-ribbon protein
MPENMKEQIKNLVKLQNNELCFDRIQVDLLDIPRKIEAFDVELEVFKKQITEDTFEMNEVKKTYRSLESDTNENLSKIKKSENKLGSVKTNKEYQSSLKEIDDLKASNSKIEDQILQCLERMEQIESIIGEKNKRYLTLSKQTALKKEEIRRKQDTDLKKLEALNKQINEVTLLIDPELIEKFSKIKRFNKNKIAIVSAVDAVCSGCNLNIPPQMYNELQRFDNLHFCPFCNRMIYCEEKIEDKTSD